MSINLKFKESIPDIFFHEIKLSPLSLEEVNQRKLIFNKNVIQKHGSRTWNSVLLNSVLDPFNVLLIGISFLSITLDDYKTFFIMIIMVFISGGIRFIQEIQSETKLNDLTSMVKNNVTVIRRINNQDYEESVNLNDCVPGDFIKLAAGDRVLADIQLIKSNNLYVDQSILTGESMTCLKNVLNSNKIIIEYDFLSQKSISNEKTLKIKIKNFFINLIKDFFCFDSYEIKPKVDSNILTKFDTPDICFMGTSIISGTGLGIILNTGKKTYFGIMSESISFRKPKTSFDKGIKLISFLFIFLMVIISIPILLLKGLDLLKQQEKLNNYQRWVNAAQFALSVAIGLTPEMLPMILNANLAKGTIFLSNKNCIVKRLQSIINLGSMNVLCTDKTGTLTENYAQLNKVYDYLKNDCLIGLELAYLNSSYQSGFKNLTDQAIIIGFENKLKLFSKKKIPDSISISQESINDIVFNKIKEIPFDFNRRKTSVFFEIPSLNLRLLITKGAVNEMLDVCSFFLEQPNSGNKPTVFSVKTLLEVLKYNLENITFEEKNNSKFNFIPKPISLEIKTNLKIFNEQLNQMGFRVLAVAYKLEKIDEEKSFLNSEFYENNLVFVSFLSFYNPPKESAANAITALIKNNIQIKVLSGDTVEVCRNICQQLNLPTEHIVSSKELIQMTELNYKEVSSKTVIFSQLTPLQKLNIVKSLKSQNFVVGFLGDGINDVLALKDSDIGISVDSGTEIAKDAADIVLLEKQLDVINDGIYYGREAYVNTVKYISMAVSGNFGNVLSILISCLWFNFLPMAPIHILLQNLLYDVSQMTMPWDNVDKETLKKPQVLKTKNIVYFMLFLGPVSTFFDIITFAFLYLYYDIKNENDDIKIFQTGWFTVGVLTQTLVCHIERTHKIPFLQSNASIQVYISTIFTLIIGILIPFTPLADIFYMKKLPSSFYFFLFIVSITYCACVQLMKNLFIYLFKFWFTEI